MYYNLPVKTSIVLHPFRNFLEMTSAGWRTSYAKITLLSFCTPSPLTRRGQGEVEMAHKYAFTVQKCAVNLSDMKKIITNQNAHYQIPTTKYQLKICRSLCKSVQ